MTRNSFKRKVIVFGIMIFASIALISTGFAAWIISQNAKQEGEGNIAVGVVTDNNIKIDEIKFTDGNKFTFEPSVEKKDIKTWEANKVYVYRADNTDGENLSVTFTAVIHKYKVMKKLNVKLVLPDGIKNAGNKSYGTKSDQSYIVLPECATATGVNLWVEGSEQTVSGFSAAKDDGKDTLTITYTITFKWGDFFGNKNPSEYYNNMTTTQQAEHIIADEMTAFRNVMAGDDKNADLSGDQAKFTIILEATAE